MKLGIYGEESSGRQTVYEAVSAGLKADDDQAKSRRGGQMTVVSVPDDRLPVLTGMFNPKKTIPARLTYFLPDPLANQTQMFSDLAVCDGLVFVIRNFPGLSGDEPTPAAEAARLDEELIFRDLAVADGRMERLSKGRSKGVTALPGEEDALTGCLELLNAGKPIRLRPDLADHQALKQYAFLSAKPRLLVINNAEGEDAMPELGGVEDRALVLQAEIECELARMEPEDAGEFRQDYGLTEPGLDRVVRASLDMLGVISFLTVGEDEVRAWTVPVDSPAVKAAGAIHSDLEKGFIRAEVVHYDDLIEAGSMTEAKKRGTVRLEGKDYTVVDGDIMNIRFNV